MEVHMKKILAIAVLMAGLVQASLWAQQVPVVRAFETPLRDAVKVEQRELPLAVQRTLFEQMGPVRVEDIDRGMLEGRTVYEIGFKRDGVHTEVRIAEDGTFLGMEQLDGQPAPPTVTQQPQQVPRQAPQQVEARPDQPRPAFHWFLQEGQKISWDQAPAAVQQTLLREAGPIRIDDVVRGQSAHGPAYQIAFKENGRHTEVRLIENGAFVESRSYEEWSPLAQHVESPRNVDNLLALPAPVLNTLREEAGRVPVDAMVEGWHRGEVVYKFTFRQPDRRTVLQLGADGRIMDKYERALDIGFSTQLQAAQPLQFHQAPEPVQTTIRQLAGRAQVEQLRVGQLSNQSLYEAQYSREGKVHTVRVTPDGFILQEAQIVRR
jgi:hypothetical protein